MRKSKVRNVDNQNYNPENGALDFEDDCEMIDESPRCKIEEHLPNFSISTNSCDKTRCNGP